MPEVSVKTLGRNSIFAAVMQVWQIGSRFVLTPVIIHRIGLEGYGTWALLFGICAYVSMFDTSFGFAYAKFTAEYSRKQDYRTLSRILGSGITLISGFGVATLLLIWLVRRPLLHAMKVPAVLMDDAQWALLIVGVCFLLRISFGSVYQVLAGLQRIDLQYKLVILSSALEFGLALAGLARGYGLLALAFAHLCGQIAGVVVGRIFCWRLCPGLRISPFRLSRWGLRQIISLGGRFQFLSLINTMIGQAVMMLISGLCGVSFLALFELADKIIGLGKTVSGSLIAPLMPAFAHLYSGHEQDRWVRLYRQGSKLVASTAAASMGFLFLFADRLIVLWTGRNYPEAAWTIRAMVFSQFLTLLTGVGTASLRGKGTLALEIRYVLVSTLAMLTLGIPALLLGGRYTAIVLVLVISQSIGALWFLAMFSRQEGLDARGFLRDIPIKTFGIGAIPTALSFLIRPVMEAHLPWWSPRWSAVLEIALSAPVFAVLTGLALWYGVFSTVERQLLLTSFRMKKEPDPLSSFTPLIAVGRGKK